MKRLPLTFDSTKWHACIDHPEGTCDKAPFCYAYALNNPKDYLSQPGMEKVRSIPPPYYDSFNKLFEGYSLEEFMHFMLEGAMEDGLIRIGSPVGKADYYVVAVFFKDHPSNFNIHWYRQDEDGSWSHKDGSSAISNRNSKGNAILDPRDLINTKYPIFGSFFSGSKVRN
jgi:hypothetical protein